MKHKSNYSISKRRILYEHDFDWSSSEILHKDKHTRKREIADVIFISKNNNSNLKRDIENLCSI